MKSVIRWAIRNTPAMNTLMVAILVVGGIGLFMLRREVFPEFDLEIIQITVPYPGASPAEVEEGICQKIEEAVRSIDGIKKLNSISMEGSGTVVMWLHSDVPDVQKVLNEARSEVDRIPSFPELAEDPIVKQITLRRAAIRLGVIGPSNGRDDAEVRLREVAEKVRDDLLALPSISQAKIVGAKEYQIDIEISEKTLREYGLTLQQVAQIVRRENLEMPGGRIRTDSQIVLLRGKNKQLVGEEIAKIPLVTRPDGVVLTVGDLGSVRDEFVDRTAISLIDGKPGLVISVDKTSSEDILAIAGEVNKYKETKQLPPGYELTTWADASVMVRDRMELLGRNGLQGLVLVFVVLAIFLELRLAGWVALGIPISILGACGYLFWADQTLNMLSMFAFLMALGILVDDAIVVGENVYSHRQRGAGIIDAAVNGTHEVLPSVIASVSTTIVAFAPLLFVPGIMGKFIAVMPIAVIAMLVISLVESSLILPCHLAHGADHEHAVRRGWVERAHDFRRRMPPPYRWTIGSILVALAYVADFLFYPFQRLGALFGYLNGWSSRILDRVIGDAYTPFLRWSLNNPLTVACAAAAILMIAIGCLKAGIVPFNAFPKLDANSLEARIIFPDGTPAASADEATRRLESVILELNEEYESQGMPLIKMTRRTVGMVSVGQEMEQNYNPGGSHVGSVGVELVDSSERKETSQQVLAKWREMAGDFPGAESLSFRTESIGPGGMAIEFAILGPQDRMADIEDAIEACKNELLKRPGVQDLEDNSRPGKWEFQLTVKDDAQAMGVPLFDLAGTVRAAYYGEEVMRLQRGRHEVKLMVRYPRSERRSLTNFDDIRVRTGGGGECPLTELANVEVQRGFSEINRLNQMRAITITGDVDEAVANKSDIIRDFKKNFLAKLLAEEKYAGLSDNWEGQQEQTDESMAGLRKGLMVALIVMFCLLTLEFRSYLQPLLILAIIPFGAIGAIVGHALMDLPVTLFSVFGMVALTGVVVNDSIVLVDFINRRVREGIPIKEALLDAGPRRFRPVLLTSLTTIAGLLPILTETSFQAQVIIPMAVSLSFGLMFATVMVLVLIPTFYLIYYRMAWTDLPRPHRRATLPAPPEQMEVGGPVHMLNR